MTATYDPNVATAKDRLRRRLGDTFTETPILADETYQGAIDLYGGSADDAPNLPAENAALVFLAASLVAEYAAYPVRVDENGVTLDFSERVKGWQYVVSQAQTSPSYPTTSAPASWGIGLPYRAGWPATDEYGRPVSPRWWPL